MNIFVYKPRSEYTTISTQNMIYDFTSNISLLGSKISGINVTLLSAFKRFTRIHDALRPLSLRKAR